MIFPTYDYTTFLDKLQQKNSEKQSNIVEYLSPILYNLHLYIKILNLKLVLNFC